MTVLFISGAWYNIYCNDTEYRQSKKQYSTDSWREEKHRKLVKRRYWYWAVWIASMTILLGCINYFAIPTIAYNNLGIYGQLFLVLLALNFAFRFDNDGDWQLPPLFFWSSIFILLVGLGVAIYSWDWFHASHKQRMLQVETVSESDSIVSPIPVEKMCKVSPAVARRVIATMMGDLKNTYNADAMTKQSFSGKFVATDFNGKKHLIDYQNQIIYVAVLEHKSFFTWWKQPYSEGYAIVDASDESKAYLVKEVDGVPLKIYYQKGAYFNYNMERHLRFNGYSGFILDDLNIELNEKGLPFSPVTLMKNTIAAGTPVVEGIALLDVQSGKIEKYGVNDAPAFVNMIQPEGLIYDRLDCWGEYVDGYINPSDKGRMKACAGMDVVQTDNGCYYYVGIQAKKDTVSTEGYMLISTRNGKAQYFKRQGICEQEAIKVFTGNKILAQDVKLGILDVTEPIFYNIEGLKTYFTTYVNTKDVTINYYAFCSADDKKVWGFGETMEKAKASYLHSYYKSLDGKAKEINTTDKQNIISAEVEIVEKVQEGNAYYFKFKGMEDKTFYAYSESKPDVRWKSEKVKISYNKTDAEMIPLGSFEIIK